MSAQIRGIDSPANHPKPRASSFSDFEQRAAVRYPVNTDTNCPFVLPVTQDLGPARIKDISTDGIGLLLNQKVDPGTILVIGLRNNARNFVKMQLVHVVHATLLVGGLVQVGGTFLTPLTYDELTTFLM